ncbi:DUF1496 domain-containing protein [Pseudoalteromonas sp. S2755]|uniref:DUF1496 domain-containing protein n=1 Tax=Pseudoalteromonas sp. S2755 TaxID=2066523 RepID=UPI00110A3DE9|nr:DUF1496 domain-containing protein [Pseudoalteromonas sp. S2755]TMN45879.1 hypothetical protein CWC03_01100 [Pseudoalteromonas sp. S2755]
MNRLTLTVVSAACAVSGSALSGESVKPDYDPTKYCYYADQAYSKGAVEKQNNKWKVCVDGGPNGELQWVDQ